uniref:Transcription initiation factor sigma n=1 Tax=Reclinomonas americana TaxID=48483 RepID=O21282_RECAM|nr:transcription initiation factor sigma [Reclinomonas americana]AAD11909.1 transcription initiation factor sigma [Reclinomonas americana]
MYINTEKKLLINIFKRKLKQKFKNKEIRKQYIQKKISIKNNNIKKKNLLLFKEDLQRRKRYKKYSKTNKKLESLLYFEYYEYYYKKINDDLILDKDDFNSIKKEKELFYNYDKTQIIIIKILFENSLSQNFFFPITKDVKRIHKNPTIITKYFLDLKKLEKMFLASNKIKIKDTRLNYLVKNSYLNLFKTVPHDSIYMNYSYIQTPLNILKEYLQLIKIINVIILQINKNIKKKNNLNISLFLYKFYQELKWNYIFINKISRNTQKINIKTLKNSYITFYNLITFIQYYTTKKQRLKKDIFYKQIFIKTFLKQHKIPKINKIKNNSLIKYGLTHIYDMILISILRENIKVTLKNRIIFNYMPYITTISKQYVKIGYQAQFSDLIQEGISGVSDAAEKFQLGRGVRFLTYAYWWMHNYMMKATIKKKKKLRFNEHETPRKELLLKIEKLQTEIDKKKKLFSLNNFDNKINTEIIKLQKIKKILNQKELILYYLFSGIPPYKIHTLEQLANIFSVPYTTIQTTLKKIKKKIAII